MTARFDPAGPYGFTGAENPRRDGETRAAHAQRDYDYCMLVVARVEMSVLRAYRRCPDAACRRARCCVGNGHSCRAAYDGRMLGYFEQELAIDYARAELQRMRRAKVARRGQG